MGENPTYEFIFNVSQNFHEAPIYVPTQNKLYSSQLKPSGFLPQYVIDLSQDTLSIETIELDPPLYAPNDAQYVNGSIYWAVAGGNSSIGNPPREQRPGIYKTDPATGKTICLLNNYFGYYFNGLNDLAVHKNGDIWFTDTSKCRLCEVWLSWQSDRDKITHGGPISPRLRRKRTLLVSHRARCWQWHVIGRLMTDSVYRFRPSTGSVNIVEESLQMANGIEFSPDQKTLYLTDSGSAGLLNPITQKLGNQVAVYNNTGHRTVYASTSRMRSS